MSGELSKLSPEDALPSWWTNKVAVAVDKLDGMADYLDTQVEEVDLDEARGMTAHVIVMRKKDNKNLSVSVVANTKNVNAKKKEGFVIDQAILAPNGASATFAKEIQRIIRDGDKNPKTGGYVKEETDLDELMPATKHVAKSKKNPDMFCVFDKDGNEVKLFKDKKDAEEYAIKNHDALNEEADLDEASARGDAKRSMSRDRDLSRKGSSLDKDDFATDDDVKAASKNIMMQLRKAANLRGTFAVEFGDKKKVKVDPKVAQAAASKYNSLRRPADKEKFQMQIAKSYKDMLGAIKEAVSPAQQAAIAISKKERGEKPKKESKFDTINKQLKGEK
jgi:hypothetical protein